METVRTETVTKTCKYISRTERMEEDDSRYPIKKVAINLENRTPHPNNNSLLSHQLRPYIEGSRPLHANHPIQAPCSMRRLLVCRRVPPIHPGG